MSASRISIDADDDEDDEGDAFRWIIEFDGGDTAHRRSCTVERRAATIAPTAWHRARPAISGVEQRYGRADPAGLTVTDRNNDTTFLRQTDTITPTGRQPTMRASKRSRRKERPQGAQKRGNAFSTLIANWIIMDTSCKGIAERLGWERPDLLGIYRRICHSRTYAI